MEDLAGPIKKAPVEGTYVWCFESTSFLDDYKAGGGDWSDSDVRLFWKKEDAREAKRKEQIELLLENLTEEIVIEEKFPHEEIKKIVLRADEQYREFNEKPSNEKDFEYHDKIGKEKMEQLKFLLDSLDSKKLKEIFDLTNEGEFVNQKENLIVYRIKVE